jgi:ATP-dependent Clp protease ATP-binding subunit ClpC
MSQVTVTIPVLVQHTKINEQQQYHISPVFYNSPIGVNRRYEQAVAQFRKEVRAHFKGYAIGRKNADHLLWYLFNPDLKHYIFDFNFVASKQLFRGKISVVIFQVQEQWFACLPSFHSFTFALESGKKKAVVKQQVQETIEKLLRVNRKRLQTNTLDLESYWAEKGEFVTVLNFKLNVTYQQFKFSNSPDNWFFSFLSGQEDFDGADEVGKVGHNLNELFPANLQRAFERETQIEQLQTILYAKENTPLVILGADGVGKHSLIQEVVYRYCRNWTGSDSAKMQRLWHIDPTRIIAGMSIVGMWQKRFESILHHLKNRQKTTSDQLLIDNVVAMLRIGKSAQNSMTLSDVLKPYLEKRQLQVVLIATPEEWKIVQEKDRRFTDLFQVLRLQEPDMPTAVRMVLEYRKQLELKHACTISIPAVRQLFAIQRNYFKRKALPGSVCKLLTQLAVKHSYGTVDVEEVQAAFEIYSGLSSQIFDDSYVFEDQEIERYIRSVLIGQDAAVQCMSDAIHTIKAKLNNPNKPLGSFFFIGPTGVGKTEAAKIVCEYLLGDANKLMRFDMNEYIDAGALSRLIGDYYNPEGQLTGKVRYNPFGVLLFDEIEKAHPKIHDLLLQVLDDGRLTDALGRTVDFANTIIIMTSNIGAAEVSQQLGFQTQNSSLTAIYQKAVENFFRPEFINRIDQTVIFNPLELEHILKIAKLQIQSLLSRDGFVRRTTILNISDEALEWVARRGFNAKMGGRALKRQIEKDLTAFSAEQLTQTTAEQPIILSIELEKGVFKPKIEVLQFAQPMQEQLLPHLPNERQIKRFYKEIIKQLEQVEQRLLDLDQPTDYYSDEDGGSDSSWPYYDLKEQLLDLKEHANRMLLGFRSPYFDRIVSIALRLKSSGTGSIIYKNDASNIDKTLIKERLFSKSALEELRYVYQNAPDQFDRYDSICLTDFLNVAFLDLKVQQLEEDRWDVVELYIQSPISGQGKKEIKHLKTIYEKVLEEMGWVYQLEGDCFTVEGYGVEALLQGESGYHLFYRSHQNPLPIRVSLQKMLFSEGQEAGVEEKVPLSGTNLVVRLYDLSLGETHKAATVTDLRTGYTNQARMTAEEYKLLLYASLYWYRQKEASTLSS